MPRPKKERCVELRPCIEAMVPAAGKDLDKKSERTDCICLKIDEFEAIRLADYLNMYHEEAARRMGVSRVTFGRILKRGRSKIAKALIEGLPLMFEKN